MAIDIDISREIRGVEGLRALVRAILAAHASDETFWVEWKTSIDLTSKDACMKVASAILGLANRRVDEAARACGGFGYLVVGAEPGNLTGTVVPDPADWVPKVEQYLKGDTTPKWVPTTIPIDGVNVLVVTVDPPQQGDPIWTVRKELTPVTSGAVFVRKPGRTDRATAEDMDALQHRLLGRTPSLPDLAVELVGDLPLPWLPGPATREHVTAWARAQRELRADAARAVEDGRNEANQGLTASDEMDQIGLGGNAFLRFKAEAQQAQRLLQDAPSSSGLRSFQPEPDRRTLEEYLKELDAWVEEFEKAAQEDLLRRYFERGFGLAQVKVTNNSIQYLPDVEVRLHMDLAEIEGFEAIPDGRNLPRPPRPFGEPKRNPMAAPSFSTLMPLSDYDYGVDHLTAHLRDTIIEDGSNLVTLDIEELRPRQRHVGDEFHILLLDRPGSGVVPVRWSATVRDRDWITEGAFEVPVEEAPVDVATIFDAGPDDG